MEKLICDRLKQYRMDHNLTQHEMAKVLGVSIGTYNALEKGRKNVTTGTVDKIATLLKITVKKVRDNL